MDDDTYVLAPKLQAKVFAMAVDELVSAAAEKRAAILSPNQAVLILLEIRRAEATHGR